MRSIPIRFPIRLELVASLVRCCFPLATESGITRSYRCWARAAWAKSIGQRGSRIAFSGPLGLYVKNASGGQEELLLEKGGVPTDWSRDGKYLLYTKGGGPQTRSDIWYLPLDPSGKPGAAVAFLRTEATENQGQFSPDGHWVAYVSDESGPGQFEVYVRRFPFGGGTTKISRGVEAIEPRWRADGKELYYLRGSPHKLMAVSMQSRPGGMLQAGVPQALFDSPTTSLGRQTG